jgi:hypothetical protein
MAQTTRLASFGPILLVAAFPELPKALKQWLIPIFNVEILVSIF